MRPIDKIFIHHSASEFGDAKLINSWHIQQGWSEIGYHFVVLNGYRTSGDYKNKKKNEELIGHVEKGRDIEKIGSHVLGHNTKSIGICLVHDKMPYHEHQLKSYRELVVKLMKEHNVKIENVLGHYEVDKKKPLCPSLNMSEERKRIKEMLL